MMKDELQVFMSSRSSRDWKRACCISARSAASSALCLVAADACWPCGMISMAGASWPRALPGPQALHFTSSRSLAGRAPPRSTSDSS